jgi:hypothetical protein
VGTVLGGKIMSNSLPPGYHNPDRWILLTIFAVTAVGTMGAIAVFILAPSGTGAGAVATVLGFVGPVVGALLMILQKMEGNRASLESLWHKAEANSIALQQVKGQQGLAGMKDQVDRMHNEILSHVSKTLEHVEALRETPSGYKFLKDTNDTERENT